MCIRDRTPYPGTALYAQFHSENRLLPGRSRTQFGWSHAVFQPKLMSPEELESGVQRTYDGLCRHFRGRLPGVLLKRWRLLIQNPRLAGILLAGSFRRASVKKEPV